MRKIFIASLVVSLLGATSFATAEAPPAWFSDADIVYAIDTSDPGSQANSHALVRTIRTSVDDGPIILLTCTMSSAGSYMLQAGFQTRPSAETKTTPTKHLRMMSKWLKLSIGEKTTREKFAFDSESVRFVPKDRKIAKRIFNAVVKGETISIQQKQDTYVFANPGQDPVFVAFAKSCPVTNGGKIDDSLFDKIPGGDAN